MLGSLACGDAVPRKRALSVPSPKPVTTMPPEFAPLGEAEPVREAEPPAVQSPPASSNTPIGDAGASDSGKAAARTYRAAPEIALAGKNGDSVDLVLQEADSAYNDARYQDAEALYQKARRGAPKRAAPIVGVARSRIRKLGFAMELASAKNNSSVRVQVNELRLAIKTEPDFGPAHVELGRALLLLDDVPKALTSLERGAELLPREAEAQSAYGVALLASGKAKEAIVALTRARELDPETPQRHGNLGTALMLVGRTREAVSQYEEQARILDGDARAHSDLGTALLAAGELERGSKELERAVELDPNRASIRSNLGYALQLRGKTKEAIQMYREAIRLDEKAVSAWINLGALLGRDVTTRGEGKKALERARALDPSDPRVLANLNELEMLEKKK